MWLMSKKEWNNVIFDISYLIVTTLDTNNTNETNRCNMRNVPWKSKFQKVTGARWVLGHAKRLEGLNTD